ncbi:MAG: LysR family transcriptional regulator [Magnetovibrio sp.]|nr:LysR family transcriptional regulator [Magnetovibrio sp.]
MSVTLRQLRYFENVARCGSLTEAARRLNISQSALSLAIKDLEQFFDARLFDRHNTGVEMTSIGQLVFAEARKINRNVKHLQSLVHQCQNPLEGEVCIGLSTVGLAFFIPKLLSDFRALYPNITLSLINVEWPDIPTPLRAGKMDFALSAVSQDHDDDIETRPLRVYPRRLWVHGNHPLSMQEAIPITALSAERLFLYEHDITLSEFSAYLDDFDLTPEVYEPMKSTEAMRNLVEADIGVTILSEFSFYTTQMAEKNVYCRRLLPTPPPFIIGSVTNRAAPLSEAASVLHDFLIDRAASV